VPKKEPKSLPVIENRKARHDYAIGETLECGVMLMGSEIKVVREGKVSLTEGFCRVTEFPPTLTLHQVHIGEYRPAGSMGHKPIRARTLLAHRGEIAKIARKMTKGMTIVPLKMYFKGPWAKVLIGIGTGKKAHDKREALKQKDAKREMQRAMSRRF
jgi:SsrA-binding protein